MPKASVNFRFWSLMVKQIESMSASFMCSHCFGFSSPARKEIRSKAVCLVCRLQSMQLKYAAREDVCKTLNFYNVT